MAGEGWRGGAVRIGVSAGASPASHFQQVVPLAFRRGMASPPRSCSRLGAIAPRILVLAARLDDEGWRTQEMVGRRCLAAAASPKVCPIPVAALPVATSTEMLENVCLFCCCRGLLSRRMLLMWYKH